MEVNKAVILSEEELLCKIYYQEVMQSKIIPLCFIPYAFQGHYYAIHRLNFLTNLYGGYIHSNKTDDYLQSKLMDIGAERYFPTEDLFKLLLWSGWIIETGFYSQDKWYKAILV